MDTVREGGGGGGGDVFYPPRLKYSRTVNLYIGYVQRIP